MNHIAEGTLQAHLDGELSPVEAAAVAAHVASCAECGAELEELQAAARRLSGALRSYQPTGRAAPVAARVVDARRAGRRPAPFAARTLARAALLVLGLAAAASAAIPGSPVRRWLQELVTPSEPAPRATEAARMTETPAASGVTVLPADGRVEVALSEVGEAVVVRVRLTDAPTASVRAQGATVRFRTGTGRIEVVGAATGELLVELPRAGTAAVSLNGRPYLSKEGETVRLLAPATDSTGSELIFRAPQED